MTQEGLRVLLVDDHRLLTESLGELLRSRFKQVYTCESGVEAEEVAARERPNVVVLDISMPEMNGFETAEHIKRVCPEAKLIFLTMHSVRAYVDHAFRAGASAYVLKRSASGELLTAIESAMRGERYISPSVPKPATSKASEELLTGRQIEVLKLIAEGCSAKEIAFNLGISLKTVEFHKAAITQRLGLRSTAQLTRYAIEHRLTNA